MRILAFVLAAFYVVNGATMIAAPEWWYGATPGVSGTGPYNPHFVVDVGIAFVLSGALIAWGAAGAGWRLVLAGAAFPAGHALFHIVGLLSGHTHGSIWTEVLGVIAPSGLALWAAWSLKTQEN